MSPRVEPTSESLPVGDAPPVHTNTPAGAGTAHPAPASSTGELAALLGADLVGPADLPIERLEMLDRAGPASLGFIGTPRFAKLWSASRAGAAVAARGLDVPGHDPATRTLLIVDDVDAAMTTLLEHFASAGARDSRPEAGIHPTAIVHPSATLGRNVSIGHGSILGPGSTLGDNVTIASHVTIGAGASIGEGTTLNQNVTVADRCIVGRACIVHPGVVIGADGFGYRPAPDGRGVVKIPHIGHVEIGDAVEIGANSCIDRAKFGATTIGSGTKIDNLVQIAHNCRIGRACILCGQVGLAGSVVLGDGVVLGGAVGIADHLTIGDGAKVAARSGVMNDIPPGETWIGLPAAPASEATRNYAAFRKLSVMMQRFRQFERSQSRSGD